MAELYPLLSSILAIACIALAAALIIVIIRYSHYRFKRREDARRDTRYDMNADLDLDEKIKMSKKHLETTLDAIQDLICVIDSDFIITRVNKSYAGHVGSTVQELPGQTCYRAFWNRDSACEDCPARQTMASGKAIRKSAVTKRIGDEIRLFEIGTYAVSDHNNNVVNVIEHIRDITVEKRMNEQLMRSEKLASIGIMTAGIAHEMNNPLSGISGTAVNLLKMPHKFGLNDKGLERVTMILECAARATMIMKDLLRFSQKQEMVRIPTDLSALIPKAVSSVRIPGSSRIKKIYTIPENFPKVRCDPSKLEQVIVNVTTNALQSILEKRRKEPAPPEGHVEKIEVKAYQLDDEVGLDFADNGVGIAPDIVSKIFDPFFTTRAPGEGTGLGLSICHRIIEEHQGRMSATTKDGETTISIVLPIGKDPWGEAGMQRVSEDKRGVNV